MSSWRFLLGFAAEKYIIKEFLALAPDYMKLFVPSICGLINLENFHSRSKLSTQTSGKFRQPGKIQDSFKLKFEATTNVFLNTSLTVYIYLPVPLGRWATPLDIGSWNDIVSLKQEQQTQIILLLNYVHVYYLGFNLGIVQPERTLYTAYTIMVRFSPKIYYI